MPGTSPGVTSRAGASGSVWRLAAEKVLEAFAGMAGGKPGGARLFFIVVALAPVHPDLLVQQALDALDHAGIVFRDHLADFDTGIEQFPGRNDLGEEPDALRLLSIDYPSGVEELFRLRQTDEQRQ